MACAGIAEALSPHGFRYAKSGPHSSGKDGEFTYGICFQSSHRNLADTHVALWIHAKVLSRRLRRWPASQPTSLYSGDFVAGGQIGNLMKEHKWMNWNVSDPVDRQSVVDDAAATVRNIALPYFRQFDDIPALSTVLQQEEVPSMEIGRAIDFLMCYVGRAAASKAMHRFLATRPDLRPQYFDKLKELQRKGLNAVKGGGFAHQLAIASFPYALPPVPND